MHSSNLIGRSLCIVTLCAALCATAQAEEIIVQNDSVTESSSAVIVGDFIEGERAGARLTSPCDGTIVGVQIFWLEGTPGHGQSLEQAIYIYADGGTGSFPTPGTLLETLEGPVMTPGYLNEFRYLDEAQTIPLNVPVSSGEPFYVVFEFYNATNVGNGGPSVVRDNDGCSSDANVLFGNLGLGWNWYDFCMVISGDLAIRAIIECPGVTGACCYTNGNCANDIEEADCLAESGTWYEGQTCGEIECNPSGACCVGSGCLDDVDPDTCDLIGGVYAGDGSTCASDICIAGACCIPETGECVENFEFECDAIGGVFQGAGTICDPNPCPQPTGACCFGEVCIAGQTEAQCSGAGGTWGGAWSTCDDNNSNGVPDICETGCPNPGDSGVYCTADLADDDCVVNLADLQTLLASYGKCPGDTSYNADANITDDGEDCITLADLQALLAQYGDDCN